MPITFDDEEDAYQAWLTANPLGYVVNRRREHDPTYLKLHRPTCWHIRSDPKGNFTTNAYLKVCSLSLEKLQRWAREQIGGPLDPCANCMSESSRSDPPRPDHGNGDQRAMPIREAYAFASERGLGREVDRIRGLEFTWGRSYSTSVRRGYMVELLEARGLFQEFKARHWPFGNTPGGASKHRRYLRLKGEYERYLQGETGPAAGAS